MSTDFLDLYDYRSRVFEMYRERNAALLSGRDPETVCQWFRRQRDRLFGSHTQSALDVDSRTRFSGLPYFAYDPALVVEASIRPHQGNDRIEVEAGTGELMPLAPVARLTFTLAGCELDLTMYWIEVYGGGLFLPFRDETAPEETYGGGRYLFDTIKGSDFLWGEGGDGSSMMLDFNYAYNPSCAYDPRWSCPLAPRENRLPAPIRAGERKHEYGASTHP